MSEWRAVPLFMIGDNPGMLVQHVEVEDYCDHVCSECTPQCYEYLCEKYVSQLLTQAESAPSKVISPERTRCGLWKWGRWSWCDFDYDCDHCILFIKKPSEESEVIPEVKEEEKMS